MSEDHESNADLPVRDTLLAASRHSSMRWVFTTSAVFTIVALGLIIFFLFKEGVGFFKQYQGSLITYRQSGLEYTGLLESHYRAYVEVGHKLTAIRSDWINRLRSQGLRGEALESEIRQPKIDPLLSDYRNELVEIREYIDEKMRLAIAYRERLQTLQNHLRESQESLAEITGVIDEYANLLNRANQSISELFKKGSGFDFGFPSLNARLEKTRTLSLKLSDSTDEHILELTQWDAEDPAALTTAVLSFFTGTKWITASDQQNWYGILPLATGTLLISAIALLIASPIGIGAAIYVNQIATPREKAAIKPFVEFTSAMPTVVLGFFGVMVFGEFIREFSRMDAVQWLPFFPIQERLNAITAGTLLGFMAIPTIFTLTEEALNSVPDKLKEASYAIGATRLQTTWRTIIPFASSGIISAVMLGFGRVIGETMVVLLCAGNRVKIPEFSEGIQALFEPMHTMTGMIAQEMGEVVYGSLHYRALFMVGLVLFFASLTINYTARTLARRNTENQRY